MSDGLTEEQVTYELKKILVGASPLFAMISWLSPNKILIGRNGQRWLITIQEIPS